MMVVVVMVAGTRRGRPGVRYRLAESQRRNVVCDGWHGRMMTAGISARHVNNQRRYYNTCTHKQTLTAIFPVSLRVS